MPENDHPLDLTELLSAFPDADPLTELADPTFARLTSPEVGLSPLDAYYLTHREAIRERDRAEAAAQATERLTAALLGASRRPEEAGLRPTAAATAAFDWRRADPETRLRMKQRIRQAAARGERIYPGKH